MTTTIHILPQLANFVGKKLQSGEFPDVETLVNEALQEKAERDAVYQTWAHTHIADALDDVRAGAEKFANLEIVNDWVKNWHDEAPAPICK